MYLAKDRPSMYDVGTKEKERVLDLLEDEYNRLQLIDEPDIVVMCEQYDRLSDNLLTLSCALVDQAYRYERAIDYYRKKLKETK